MYKYFEGENTLCILEVVCKLFYFKLDNTEFKRGYKI